MSATITTLRWAGWRPYEPDRSVEPPQVGDIWIADGEHPESRQVLQRVGLSTQRRLWARAQAYYEGEGLEQGAYTHTLELVLAKLKEPGKLQEASALRAAAIGAIWPAARVAACFLGQSARCPRGQADAEAAAHRFWERHGWPRSRLPRCPVW